MRVVLADYGAGNLRSVCSALARAGAEPVIAVDPEEVLAAPLAVVAGVGHAGAAAVGLGPLADALRDRAAAGRPVLGICVGMQLLFEQSEEGGAGLGLLRGPVRRLRARTVPHMGWNTLAARQPSALLAVSTAPTSTSPTATPPSPRTTSRRPSSTTTARSSRRSSPVRSPASSSIPSGAAPPAPACSRTRCDGQEAPDPVPRRRRRPRRQGRPLRTAARRRRSGRARPALLRGRRRRARLPRHHGERRGARGRCSSSSSGPRRG